MKIHIEVYNDFLVNVLAAPTYLGIKPPSERFAGAINSMTCEGIMRDGKALQMATTHELGQNFAKAFDIFYQSEEGQSSLCHTTSWGASTRLVGGLIMMHGDDHGLVVPPRLAPIQVVVVAVRDEPTVNDACAQVARSLKDAGVRVSVDRARGSFGRRITDWEIKGVPVRVEVGPRDLAEGLVTMVRRDNGQKNTVALDAVGPTATSLLEQMQSELFESARAFLHSSTHDVSSVIEAVEAAQTGFARLDWSLVGDAGEAELKRDAITVRCLQRRDGSIPIADTEEDLVCIVAKSY
jgi:prolyl-tRNA synthetase